MKNCIQTKCERCGKVLTRFYPSLMKEKPEAPSKEEVEQTSALLFSDLRYHQNHDCFPNN